jgi:thymidylate kinase
MYQFFIEGPDGSGKTTLTTALAKRASQELGESAHVVRCREPNGLIRGFRELVLNPVIHDASIDGSPETFSRQLPSSYTAILMMMAGMAETTHWLHKLEILCRKANKRLVVFQDRSVISTIIHQALTSNRQAELTEFIMTTYVDMMHTSLKHHRALLVLDAPDEVLASRFKKDSVFDLENWETTVAARYRNLSSLLLPYHLPDQPFDAQLRSIRQSIAPGIRQRFMAEFGNQLCTRLVTATDDIEEVANSVYTLFVRPLLEKPQNYGSDTYLRSDISSASVDAVQ